MRIKWIIAISIAFCVVMSAIPIFEDEADAIEYKKKINLGLAHASFIGEGDEDYLGWCLSSAGDVNGDGYDDILIGCSRNDEGGDNAGQSYLFFGKENGWQMDLNISNADASFIGENSGDLAGVVTSVGDVNGDGYDDIMVGSPGNDENGISSGQSYLIFGKMTGWEKDMNLSGSDASFYGEYSQDRSGFSISSAGDVNNDGFCDILIGAYLYYNPVDMTGGGKTYLILGKESDWRMDTNLSISDASYIAEAYQDRSGYSVSGAGDVNNDGYDDILIGAPYNCDGGYSSGKAYLILGKKYWSKNVSLSSSAISASFIGESAYDKAGLDVDGIGDMNGDGFDDFLIGAYGNDDGGSQAGQAYIFFGRSVVWSLDTDLSNADASIIGNTQQIGIGQFMSGAGDVDRDGYCDILLKSDGYLSSYREIFIIKGRANGWSMDSDILEKADISIERENYGDIKWSEISGAGDVNGDGFADVLIGAAERDEGGTNRGQVYLFNMYSTPPPVQNIDAECSKDGGQISISWNTSFYWNEPIVGYRVLRSSDGSNYELIGVSMNSFNDTDVTLGRVYSYTVVCIDGDGALSEIRGTASILCDLDTDRDGIGNAYDDDDDGDGYDDGRDMFPLNRKEWLDTDLDGTGNLADFDDDNDGILDFNDPYPLNPLDGTMTLLHEIDSSVNGIDLFMELMNNSISENLTRMELMLGQIITIQSSQSQMLMGIDTNLTSLAGSVGILGDEVRSTLFSVLSDISSLNETLRDRIDELQYHVDLNSASLLASIAELNASILQEMSTLSAQINSFRTWLEPELENILEVVDDGNEALALDIYSMIDHLSMSTLADIHSLLNELIDMSGENDTLLLQMIQEVQDGVVEFENSTLSSLTGISGDMATLSQLDEIGGELDQIDQELDMLSELEKDIGDLSKDQDDSSGKIGLGNVLNIITIVLLIIFIAGVGFMIWKKREEEGTW